MKFLESFGDANMTATRSPTHTRSSSSTTDSLVHLDPSQARNRQSSSPLSEFEHISNPSSSMSSTTASKARLLYCKSHVSIHPTQFNKDNISGYLALVEVAGLGGVKTDEEGNPGRGAKELIVSWVPDEVLQRMDEEDRAGYKKVEERTSQRTIDEEEDGFVFVSIPPPKGEKYAFSVPLSNLYSILVYPPSLQHWYGSATFNLMGGISLPTLYFHDDESPLLLTNPTQTPPKPRSQWGFPPFLSLLRTRSTMLRSRLLSSKGNNSAELWLVNPSKADREVHDAEVEDDLTHRHSASSSSAEAYPPKAGFPDTKTLNSQPTPKQTLLSGLSNITSFSRRLSQQILAHPLAQEVVPHLPPAVRSLVNAPGEWDRSGRSNGAKKGRSDVASEFESARLYLARWARVVAEEGERARRNEVASQVGSGQHSDVDDMTSSLGVFSLLTSPGSKRPVPHPTRSPQTPINSRDWESFAAQGRDELFVRREIFKRGFGDSSEHAEQRTRREGWEVLLGIIPWAVGGLGGGEAGKERRAAAREQTRKAKRQEYDTLKSQWRDDKSMLETESWKEEWHRIDVDCRRTDRTLAIFAIPTEPRKQNDQESKMTIGNDWDGAKEDEEGSSTRLNPHIAALRTILMTYHTFHPELGYVQGMSDLLSPIYYVFDANEADSFWGLVGVMKMMESNFLRDQSGMKKQLSTLQQLIQVMDPELYSHLERTGSLNLFFCFRWILISFKREFKFTDVIKLWEVLWTKYYSDQFVLFIALAVLQSHRDVLIRYLTEFDEVLKYANDLSGTIDLDTTLAQAEVLFMQFKGLVQDVDEAKAKEHAAGEGLRQRRASGQGLGGGLLVKPETKGVSDDLRELLDCFGGNERSDDVAGGSAADQAGARMDDEARVRGVEWAWS